MWLKAAIPAELTHRGYLRKNFQARRRYIIRALDAIGHDPGRFNGGALASLKRLETVIGNLREVAERRAPGRACISVVPDRSKSQLRARQVC